ncbi:MAG TPA: hypothetical protein PLA50_10910 [Bacteroidia bacterium]|nr:hypothetical protein [Bacteroidia bacterium]
MNSLFTPSSVRYLLDWGTTFAIGGAICLVLGCLAGWIIWRKARRLLESIEERNRTALADCERARDEISRIKSELAIGSR